MARAGARGPRLACVFLLGVFLFTYPMLAVFNVSGSILGVPVLYAYLFCAWGLLIVLAAFCLRGTG